MRKTRWRGTLTHQKRNQKMDRRVKLKTKRLESTSNQQVTYLRKRNGILKKAKELFILCDIDIALLMFSPIGKPTLFRRERSNIEEVITKSAQLTPQERTKSSAPKKTFKKLDHDVNIQDFLGSSHISYSLFHDAMIKHLEATVSATRLDMESLNSKMEELHVDTPHEDGGQGEDEGHEEELGRDEDDDDEGDEEESGTEDVEDGDEFSKEP
ncbi:hypothetical protein HYC85_017428 [Camellia sinensis]|uniref:MADS-box domain-containing protein n=1 Tax=Camellia sinensis TaxID=4442 RepID=A0A7J7GTV6_CAMSI|nr:hypothetical protein HYC85_017428 [Camellia sinensis]